MSVQISTIKDGAIHFYLSRGEVLFELRKFDLALKEFETVLSIDLDFHYAHYYLSLIYFNQKRYDLATAEIQRAFQLAPDNAIYHKHLADIYAEQRLFDKAESAYRMGITLNPGYVNCYIDYCRLMMSRDLDFAETIILKALQLRPTSVPAIICYSLIQSQRGKKAGAEKGYLLALKLDPHNHIAHNNLGSIYLSRKDYARAQAEFTESIRIQPTYTRAILNYAYVSEVLGDLKAAKAAYLRVIALDPQNGLAYNNLGCYYMKVKEYDKAREALLNALRLNPDYRRARNNLKAWVIKSSRVQAESAERPSKKPSPTATNLSNQRSDLPVN